MRIWIHSNLKQWNKYIVKNVLEGCHYPHFLVHIVETWKLEDKHIMRTMLPWKFKLQHHKGTKYPTCNCPTLPIDPESWSRKKEFLVDLVYDETNRQAIAYKRICKLWMHNRERKGTRDYDSKLFHLNNIKHKNGNRRAIVASTWINQTTFSLYNSLFTIQLAIWSHSLIFLP